MPVNEIKSIAFYLPQYHPTRVNDANWGAGFTEWHNVVRAKPLYDGHYQPRLPGALGFYDLRAKEVMEEQAEFARIAEVSAFCFYYYRFGSQRALEQPLEKFLAHPEIDVSFLYCWANEPWTKAWDGRSGEVLLEQSYDDVAFDGLAKDLERAMSDVRYFRVGNRPVFMIYQLEQVPEAASFVAKLREHLSKVLNVAPMIGAVYSHGFKRDMLDWIDFVVQFPPHRMPRTPGTRIVSKGQDLNVSEPARMDSFEPYDAVVATALRHASDLPKMLLGVTPDWDNSPRRPRDAHVLVGSTPSLFASWTEEAAYKTLERFSAGAIPAPVMFVNAWNEWGEGAMLEPSLKYGDAYLQAFSAGLRAGVQRFEREKSGQSAGAAGEAK